MQTYSQFRPTAFDSRGICLPEKQAWLVAPCSVNRDSDVLTRSNWQCQLRALGGESETVEVHRFGHWGPGWFEIVIIDPAATDKVKIAEEIEAALEGYPVIDEQHFSELEMEEANRVWCSCYRERERIAYIREHRSQFEFHDFRDLLGCVRGKYFAGYASELLS
jgi:hypothetical protein